VQIIKNWEGERRLRRTWKTPVGTLTDVIHYDKWHSSAHNTEYKLKSPDDFKVLEFILKDEVWFWDQATY
jgi:hypothetical protein